jgi:hypothetical protein
VLLEACDNARQTAFELGPKDILRQSWGSGRATTRGLHVLLRDKEVGRTMAHGTSRAMRSYVNKVFGIEAKPAALTDERCEPQVPQGPVLTTWFWGFAKRLGSTRQVGDLPADKRWRKRVDLNDEDGGSPDTAGRILDGLLIDEVNEPALEEFFAARRAGVLKDDGPYGLRCAIVDMNELFKSGRVHCAECQVRNKTVGEGADKHEVKEYYHQAVALVWAGGEIAWPIGWELVKPREGELPTALRLLERLLPKPSKSIDLVLGDALYCCRPYFKLVHDHGVDALAISSGVTEMDEEVELTRRTTSPVVGANKAAHWSHESEAWEKDVGCKLRVLAGLLEGSARRRLGAISRRRLRRTACRREGERPALARSGPPGPPAGCAWLLARGGQMTSGRQRQPMSNSGTTR